MAALKRLEIITPPSTRVILEAPVSRESSSTRLTAPMAPKKDSQGVLPSRPGKHTAARATAKPAPALTPMMLGAARGLWSTVCSTTPLTARAAPASRAARVRGRRTNQKIRPATLPSGP